MKTNWGMLDKGPFVRLHLGSAVLHFQICSLVLCKAFARVLLS